MAIVPKNSGLYKGLSSVKAYYDQPLETVMVDYLTKTVQDEVAEVISQFGEKLVEKFANPSSDFSLSTATLTANLIFRVTAEIIDINGVASIDDYNKAWLSVCNTSTLRTAVLEKRGELLEGYTSEKAEQYKLATTAYMISVKIECENVASCMYDGKYGYTTKEKNADNLVYRICKYADALSFDSFITSKKAEYLGK